MQARARKEASEAARLRREMEKKIEMYEELRSAFDEERGNLKDAKGEVEDLNRKLEEAGREVKEAEGRLARSQGRCKELEAMVQVCRASLFRCVFGINIYHVFETFFVLVLGRRGKSS